MPTQDLSSFLFLGEENFLKEELIEKLKAKFLTPEAKDLDYGMFYAKDKDFNIREMLDALNTPPFMAKKRIIILRDTDALPESSKESVIFYLKNPAETSIFIIDTKSNVIKGEFLLEASKLTKLTYARKLTDGEINIWLSKKAKLAGKKISIEAINLIKENLSHDLHILSSSMSNLILYTGKRPDIKRQDVENLISVSPLNTSFDLLDAIEKKDAKRALTMFTSLQKQRKKEIEFLGLLGWQFRMLLRVKELLLRNKNKIDIARELGLYSSKVEQIVRYAGKFKRKDIVGFLNDILAADRDIKTSSIPTGFIMERLIVRMCL